MTRWHQITGCAPAALIGLGIASTQPQEREWPLAELFSGGGES